MSWCRFGSPCVGFEPSRLDEACVRAGCPGSALYIYDDAGQGLRCCCGTTLDGAGLPVVIDDFFAGGDEEDPAAVTAMARHIVEHAERGDHVRRSLLAWARTRALEGAVP